MDLAVYGTLKGRVKGEFLGNDILTGFALYSDGLPYAVCTNDSSDILHIMVYEIDDHTLETIDRIEGYRDKLNYWYNRITVDTVYGPAYLYTQDNIPMGSHKIENGRY